MSFFELLRRFLPVARQVPGGPPVTRYGRDSFVVQLESRPYRVDCEMLLYGPHSFVVFPSAVYEVREMRDPYETLCDVNGEPVGVTPAKTAQVLEALEAYFDLNGIAYTVDGANDG